MNDVRAEVQIPREVDKRWCDEHLDYDQIAEFRKIKLTKAIRMGRSFTVHTSEGPLTCQDGWLCFDARGYPYPVAADEFDLIYEPANHEAGRYYEAMKGRDDLESHHGA